MPVFPLIFATCECISKSIRFCLHLVLLFVDCPSSSTPNTSKKIIVHSFQYSISRIQHKVAEVIQRCCVAVYLVEPDEIECTVPAVRNVKAFYGMEDMQFVASNPPELPAYAGYEVLHHHGNMVSMGSKIPMVMKCSLILALYIQNVLTFTAALEGVYIAFHIHPEWCICNTQSCTLLRALFYPLQRLQRCKFEFLS